MTPHMFLFKGLNNVCFWIEDEILKFVSIKVRKIGVQVHGLRFGTHESSNFSP